MDTHSGTPRTRRTFLALLGTAFASAACDLIIPASCSLAACVDGVNLELTGTVPSGGFALEVHSGGTVPSYTFDCSGGGGGCATFLFADIGRPASMDVVITTGSGSVTHSFNLTYSDFRPNGSRCDPVCQQATVQVPL